MDQPKLTQLKNAADAAESKIGEAKQLKFLFNVIQKDLEQEIVEDKEMVRLLNELRDVNREAFEAKQAYEAAK